MSCFLAGCHSNIRSGQDQPTPSGELAGRSKSPKGQWWTQCISSTPTSITGKAKAMEMTGLWGQRVALSQGWPWQTLLKPRATTTLRLHGTHS